MVLRTLPVRAPGGFTAFVELKNRSSTDTTTHRRNVDGERTFGLLISPDGNIGGNPDFVRLSFRDAAEALQGAITDTREPPSQAADESRLATAERYAEFLAVHTVGDGHEDVFVARAMDDLAGLPALRDKVAQSLPDLVLRWIEDDAGQFGWALPKWKWGREDDSVVLRCRRWDEAFGEGGPAVRVEFAHDLRSVHLPVEDRSDATVEVLCPYAGGETWTYALRDILEDLRDESDLVRTGHGWTTGLRYPAPRPESYASRDAGASLEHLHWVKQLLELVKRPIDELAARDIRGAE